MKSTSLENLARSPETDQSLHLHHFLCSASVTLPRIVTYFFCLALFAAVFFSTLAVANEQDPEEPITKQRVIRHIPVNKKNVEQLADSITNIILRNQIGVIAFSADRGLLPHSDLLFALLGKQFEIHRLSRQEMLKRNSFTRQLTYEVFLPIFLGSTLYYVLEKLVAEFIKGQNSSLIAALGTVMTISFLGSIYSVQQSILQNVTGLELTPTSNSTLEDVIFSKLRKANFSASLPEYGKLFWIVEVLRGAEPDKTTETINSALLKMNPLEDYSSKSSEYGYHYYELKKFFSQQINQRLRSFEDVQKDLYLLEVFANKWNCEDMLTN